MKSSAGKAGTNDDPDHIRILEQAATWFATMQGGNPTTSERKALEIWLGTDPRHVQAYADIDRLWRGAIDLPELKERQAAAKKRISRRRFGAAAVLAVSGLGIWQYLADYPFADYRTAKGERRRVSLPDGTVAELATETRLSVALDGTARRVRLDAGEAFFTVAPDARRPFTVEAGAGRTTALGTAFGVAYHDAGAIVAVTEHAVDVVLGRNSVRVSAGSTVSYDGDHIGPAPDQAAEAAFSWREGRLVFTQAPLGVAVAGLNRWRAGRLVVMSDALAARPITLIVNIDRTEGIVSQLAQAVPIRAVSVTPYLTLLFPAG